LVSLVSLVSSVSLVGMVEGLKDNRAEDPTAAADELTSLGLGMMLQ
jgi:hypothetical protein